MIIHTEESILKAAMDEFLLKGYNAATTQAIAERAGVNEVTIFRKFSTKKELFLSVVRHHRENAFRSLNETLRSTDGETSIEGIIGDLTRNLMDIIDERSKFLMLLFLEGIRNEELLDEIGIGRIELVLRLTQILRQNIKESQMGNINPTAVSMTFVGFLFMYMLMVYSNDANLANREDIAESFIQLFCRGIIGKDEGGR